jgi:hypothetical protein
LRRKNPVVFVLFNVLLGIVSFYIFFKKRRDIIFLKFGNANFTQKGSSEN